MFTRLLLIVLVTFAGLGSGALASSLDGLEACGISGRRFKIERGQSVVMQAGEYFHVTKIEPELQCSRRDWIFLADPELRLRLSRMLSTDTKIVLRVPEAWEVCGKSQCFMGAVVPAAQQSREFWHSHLPDAQAVMLVTPSTDLYTLIHEQKHIGDLLTVAEPLDLGISYMGMLGLKFESAQILKTFIYEMRAYGEQLSRMEKFNRADEYRLHGDRVWTIDGRRFRETEYHWDRDFILQEYGYPAHAVIKKMQHDQPEIYGFVRDFAASFVSPRDWQVTTMGLLFQDLYSYACELRLSGRRPSFGPAPR